MQKRLAKVLENSKFYIIIYVCAYIIVNFNVLSICMLTGGTLLLHVPKVHHMIKSTYQYGC